MNRWVLEGWGAEAGRSLLQDLTGLIRLVGHVQEKAGPLGNRYLLRGVARALEANDAGGVQLLRDLLESLDQSRAGSEEQETPRGLDAFKYLAAMISESGRQYARTLMAVQDKFADALSVDDGEARERLVATFKEAAWDEVASSGRSLGIAVSILSRVNPLLLPAQDRE